MRVKIWVASLSQGIDVFDPVKGFQYRITASDKSVLDLVSNKITRFTKTRDGSVWVGTADTGLHRYRKNDSVLSDGKVRRSRDACQFEGVEGQPITVARFNQISDETLLVFTDAGLFQIKKPTQSDCRLTPIEVDSGHAPRYAIEMDEYTTLITDYTALNVLERGKHKTTRIKMAVEGVESGNETANLGWLWDEIGKGISDRGRRTLPCDWVF